MLRGIGRWLGILILSISLFPAIFMMLITKFTELDNLKSVFSELLASSLPIDKTQLNQIHTTLLKECEQTQSLEMPFGNKIITLSCEDINKSSPDELMNLVGASLLNDIYYQKYDCEFIECLKQPGGGGFSVILSSKANLFFKNIQNILFACVGIGTILILISVKEWNAKLKTLGIILLSTSIPVLIILYVKDYFLPQLPAEAAAIITPVIEQIFDFLFTSFLIVAIAGAILTIAGYSLKFFQKKKIKRK